MHVCVRVCECLCVCACVSVCVSMCVREPLCHHSQEVVSWRVNLTGCSYSER